MGGLLGRVIAAHQDYFGFGRQPAQLIARFDAAHSGHDNIHHNQVRFDLAGAIQGSFAIFRFIDLPMRLLSQQGTQGLADKLLVIY